MCIVFFLVFKSQEHLIICKKNYDFSFRLGSTAEGAHLRARMQSACLMSDMEAFKVSKYHLDNNCYESHTIKFTHNTISTLQSYSFLH